MWVIELFDGLQAQHGDIIIARFRTQKTAALLAYLAFFPAPHTRDFLIELLWPEASIETGRNNLRLALASLRRQFEPPGTSQGSILVTGRVWVQLNPLAFVTDVQKFEALLNDAAKAPEGMAKNAAEWWKQALECYRGPLLRGYYEDWIPVEEQRLENLMLEATRHLIEFCEAQNDLETARYYAHKAARLSRDTEMRAEAARLLNGKQIQQKPNQNTLPSAIIKAHPPQVKRLAAPALPTRLTRFFGRADELRQIQNFLDDAQARLLTLTGSGGSGKTRLALESAWHFHQKNPDKAVCFVPLADVNQADFIADAIAQVMLLPPPIDAFQATIERVLDALREKDTRLLVLDNFEQLTGGESVVQQILAALPTLHCLVTSRRVLQVAGEQELCLRPLEVPPSGESEPVILQEFSAVRLFVDRARARRADFQITPHNANSLGELLRCLDGLPLAIEICAARSNILSPHQMLLQLQRGEEFAGEARLGLAARQNSLRAAFEWSYELLTPDLQRVLRHLALFRGGFSLQAAQAVCGNVPILSALAFLRDASLVQSAEIIAFAGHSEMRCSLLDTISKFAAEKLGDHESFAARERHALFYVDMAEATHNLGLAFTADWQNIIVSELDNLSAALEWSVDKRLDLALRFLLALQSYWRTYDPARGRASLENVVSHLRSKPMDSAKEYARILRECGDLAVRQTDLLHGEIWLQESLALSRQSQDNAGEAEALTSLGLIALQQGETAKAQQNLSSAEAIFRALNHAKGLSWTLRHQGELARRAGDLPRAHDFLSQSLALFQSLGDQSGVAWILLALGEMALDGENLESAAHFCLEAQTTFRKLGHKTGLLWALHRCALIAQKSGDKAQARLNFEECLALARQLQNQTAIDITERALSTPTKIDLVIQ